MKLITLLSMVAGLTFQAHGQDHFNSMKKESLNVSCKLTTPELQERKSTVIAELKKHIVGRAETMHGIRYSFQDSDNVIDLLTNFIKTERLCCSFFEFNLVIGESENLITLELTGPEGTKEFITSEIGF